MGPLFTSCALTVLVSIYLYSGCHAFLSWYSAISWFFFPILLNLCSVFPSNALIRYTFCPWYIALLSRWVRLFARLMRFRSRQYPLRVVHEKQFLTGGVFLSRLALLWRPQDQVRLGYMYLARLCDGRWDTIGGKSNLYLHSAQVGMATLSSTRPSPRFAVLVAASRSSGGSTLLCYSLREVAATSSASANRLSPRSDQLSLFLPRRLR